MTTSETLPRALALSPRQAVVYALLSGFLNSFGGLILRSLEGSSEWQIVFIRTGSLTLVLLAWLLIRDADAFLANLRRIGPWGGVCGFLFCSMQTSFVISLSNTTVANTVFILSSGPILTAFLARLTLGERIGKPTWIALSAALLGTSLMVGGGLSAGTLLGDAAAVLAALSFAGFVVIFRAKRTTDMTPSVVVGGFFAVILSLAFAQGSLSVPVGDVVLCLFWGGILSSLVILLFASASRYLKGGELTILLMLEYLLGPLWVWLFMSEVPSLITLVGGAIVLSGVAGQAYVSDARRRRSRRPAES